MKYIQIYKNLEQLTKEKKYMKTYITAPLVGALIGYITNWVAIKMLFRPRTAKYLFGIRLPFTPGMIPREKSRIAKSIGLAVGEKLLNKDIIMNTLISPDFHEKFEQLIRKKTDELKENTTSIQAAAQNLLGAEISETIMIKIQNYISHFLKEKIKDPDVITKITAYISKSIDQYIEKQLSNPLIRMALSFNSSIVQSIKDTVISKVSDLLYSDSHEWIDELVQDQIASVKTMEIKELIQKIDDMDTVQRVMTNILDNIIGQNIEYIIQAINIPAVIEKQINDYNVFEVEELILNIVDKELKAIIWLGAFLGFIMGFLTPLFS